ncbi:hypothetical protein [Roseobacter weihaiensis]|nr:hypothetical protein [Roseobacter sp. H9]
MRRAAAFAQKMGYRPVFAMFSGSASALRLPGEACFAIAGQGAFA